MQRYGDFWLIPRNLPDSCRSCCDKGKRLRQSGGSGLDFVGGRRSLDCARDDKGGGRDDKTKECASLRTPSTNNL